jgi:DNA-binding response OmpR family regulator
MTKLPLCVRNVLAGILSKVNHQVTVAENGEEGLRLFKEKKFDMVLTDLGMPGLSGWEVCKAVKGISPQVPVGMITGWEMEVEEKEIDENRIDFLISEPFDFSQVLSRVRENLDKRGRGFLS